MAFFHPLQGVEIRASTEFSARFVPGDITNSIKLRPPPAGGGIFAPCGALLRGLAAPSEGAGKI